MSESSPIDRESSTFIVIQNSRSLTVASKSMRDLRIAEVEELDVRIEDGRIAEYRARVKISFKYETEDGRQGI